MSVVNGQLANQNTFNNAFLSRTSATTSTVAKLALQNADLESGASVVNTQRAINKSFDTVGITGEADALAKEYSSNQVLVDGENHKQGLEKLDARFGPTLGHKHTGVSGDAPKLTPASLTGYKLKGVFVQGANFTTPAGSAFNITSILTAPASAGETSEGAVVNAPFNRVFIQDADSDSIEDDNGNTVYARLTVSAGNYFLNYFVLLGATETAYSFTAPTPVKWFYQYVYDPLVSAPVYDSSAYIPSENTTADVVYATELVSGKIFLANTAAQSVSTLNAKGVSIRAAKEDHTHRGISSLTKLGDAAQYGDATLEQGTGVTITRTGNNYKFDADSVIAVTQQTLDGTTPVTGTGRRRIVEVQSSSGVVDMSAQGIAAGSAGDELFLVGLNNDNVLIFKNAGNVRLNGDWYSNEGSVLHLIYRSSLWTQVGG